MWGVRPHKTQQVTSRVAARVFRVESARLTTWAVARVLLGSFMWLLIGPKSQGPSCGKSDYWSTNNNTALISMVHCYNKTNLCSRLSRRPSTSIGPRPALWGKTENNTQTSYSIQHTSHGIFMNTPRKCINMNRFAFCPIHSVFMKMLIHLREMHHGWPLMTLI